MGTPLESVTVIVRKLVLPPVARLAGTVTAPVVTMVEPELSVVVIADVTTAEETDSAAETIDQNSVAG